MKSAVKRPSIVALKGLAVFGAGVLVLCLAFFIFKLFEVSDHRRHAFLPRGQFVRIQPAPMTQTSITESRYLNEIHLSASDGLPIGTQELSFFIATWHQKVEYERASLTLFPSGCKAELNQGVLPDNSYLTFPIHESCAEVDLRQTSSLNISVVSSKPNQIALWAKGVQKGWLPTTSLKLRIENQEDPQAQFAVGNYAVALPSSTANRLAVITEVWKPAVGLGWLILALVVVLCGFALRRRLPIATWAFLLIGLLWVVIVPPLQAPDEPDHILSFGELIGQKADVSSGLLGLSQRTHFERIKFNEVETLDASDLNRPLDTGWADHISAPDYQKRSPVMSWLASSIAPAIPHGVDPERMVFLLRAINLLGLFFSVLISIRMASSRSPWFLFLLTPPLFFFGMHVSNYPLSLALLLPALVFIAKGLGDRFRVGWSMVCAPFLVVAAFYTNKTTAQLVPLYLTIIPIVLADLLSPALQSKFNRFAKLSMGTQAKRMLSIVMFLAVAALVVMGSRYSPLPPVEHNPHRLPPDTQAIQAALVYLSSVFGLGSDYHILKTFWEGYGWLDVPLPKWLFGVCRFSALVFWLSGLIALFRFQKYGSVIRVLLAALALALSAGFLSYTLQTTMGINLSGRYLIPSHMAFLLIGFHVVTQVLQSADRLTQKRTEFFLLSAGVGVNLLVLASILTRYYS